MEPARLRMIMAKMKNAMQAPQGVADWIPQVIPISYVDPIANLTMTITKVVAAMELHKPMPMKNVMVNLIAIATATLFQVKVVEIILVTLANYAIRQQPVMGFLPISVEMIARPGKKDGEAIEEEFHKLSYPTPSLPLQRGG